MIAYILPGIAFLCGIVCWKHLDAFLRIIGFVLLIDFIAEVAAYHIERNNGNTNWVYDYFMLVQGIFIPIAATVLVKDKRFMGLVGVGILVFLIVWAYLAFQFHFKHLFTPAMVVFFFFITIEYIIVIVLSDMPHVKHLWKNGIFCMSAAFIIYFGCNIPLFGLIQIIDKDNHAQAIRLYSHVNDVLQYISYPVQAWAFLCCLFPQPLERLAA